MLPHEFHKFKCDYFIFDLKFYSRTATKNVKTYLVGNKLDMEDKR